MEENKSINYTKIFLSVFLAIFLAGMLISPAKKLLTEFGIIKQEDRANYIDPTVHEGLFADILNSISAAQAQVDDTYINFIPFYNAIVDGVVEAKHTVNEPFTNWLSQEAKKPISQGSQGGKPSWKDNPTVESSSAQTTTSDYENISYPVGSGVGVNANFIKTKGSYTFFTYDFTTASGKSGHFLDKIITSKQSITTRPSIEGAKKMNKLAATVPNVNFYIYVCTRMSETSLRDESTGDYLGGTRENLDAFLNTLSSSISKDYFKMDTLEDRIGKVYLTDHHWNAAGLDEAYGEIISMMKKKYKTIPTRRRGTYYTVEPAYYGTYVNDMTSLFNVWDYCTENNLFDVFGFYDYNLPYHTQEGGVAFAASKSKYLTSSFTGAGKKDFYNDFYQAASYYKYPSNNTGHNLLILGDSFSVSVSELLASHFDETYFVDIRDVTKENPLNLKDFTQLNGITDILILQNSYQLMYLETTGNWANVQ